MIEWSWRKGLIFTLLLTVQQADARGVSPYLPLNLSPMIERQIERAMILAGQPVMRRPITAAAVLDALPAVCEVDPALCATVRSYLQTYMRDSGVTLLTVEANAATGDTGQVIPNAHGKSVDSIWQVAGSGFYQPFDHLLLNAGVVAYDGEVTPTGSMLSAGFDFAQLDIGYRDHWLSPMSDSSILIGTEAPTIPSVTLSNTVPLGPLGISYEVFLAQMSRQENIAYFGATTVGSPQLAGLQLSIAPVTGYAVSLNRVMQYGGGARGASLSDFIDAITVNSNRPDVAGTSQEFGNQVASLASTILFPGKVPFAVKMEFAGEDNSYAGSYRLGDSALLLGVDFPSLGQRLDASYEFSEWQNVWYTHHIYPAGLTNEGRVIGHWFGDQRARGDTVTGSSHLLRVGLRMDSGAYWQASWRTAGFGYPLGVSTLQDEKYQQLHQASLKYSTVWRGKGVDAEVYGGRGALEGTYGGLRASLDIAGLAYPPVASAGSAGSAESGVEFFVDAGMNHSNMNNIISPETHSNWSGYGLGYHFGLGVRRPVSERSDLGARIELDSVNDHKIVSLRALDYRYRISQHIGLSGFFGVGRMYQQTTALGYYWGGGVQWLKPVAGWDIGLDLRVHDKITRNRVLPEDPPDVSGVQPRIHTDIKGFSLYASRAF